MSQTRLSPMQEILRAIERVAPHAWHYRTESDREGFDPDAVEQVLELLHLEGLVARGPSTPATGPGVVLTPKGEQVVGDPDAFARLGTGEPLDPDDPGAIVRHSIRQPVPPTLTRLIILANLLVFAWCIYLANGVGIVGTFLRGSLLSEKVDLKDRIAVQRAEDQIRRVNGVFHQVGDLYALDIIHGEWWRLLTCCFVHAGILHIAMNMYALYGAGQFVEQTWGRWRYAIIYLFSGWGGSCLAMAMSPGRLVGASGAVCGVFAAIGVWFFLNGKYLPRGMAQRGRSNILTNVILMVFISLIPGVSGYAHLGGALAGGLAAVALNFARFGSIPVRALAWLVLMAIPVASYVHLEESRKTNDLWHDAEYRSFSQDWVDPIQKTMKSAIKDYTTAVKEVREVHPDRREEADIASAIAVLDKHLVALDALAGGLEKSGPYYSVEVLAIRADATSYARQRAEVYRDAKRCLEVGKEWKGADEKAFDEKWKKLQALREAWEKRLK